MYRGSASSRNISPTVRSARAVHPLFIVWLVGIGTFQPTIVVLAAERCPALTATRVVSVQGNVTWSLLDSATLQAAKLNDTLCVGDTVRVGAKSRAVLRLPNETTIPLDQNTIFRLKQSISEKEPTLIELIQGAIHVITRTPKPFKVDTPYLNATVEGTEFYVGVDSTEARVVVVEGKVNVSNELGALLLVDNEAATAKKGQAPQRTLTIKPRDAVQWALYYPPLFDPRSRSGGRNLSASHELYNQGKITDAIESLNAIPEAERYGDYYTYRAGLLLLVGRADEAEPDIDTALKENSNNTDALSLKAIIAIVRNDKVKALDLANQAVSIDDKSASARIALSYALQANFKVGEALKAARKATERDENNALAWARVAELELSIPNYDKSKEAAQRAVKLNPNLARTQSVLGFANLTRIDIKAAKESFDKAIELDQADPLPRLGIGLAKIREGNLAGGREDIEIAAALDPENSLVRSYLGKAYFEEKRDAEAGKQFELAKERDPKDPTPWFYEAILDQARNRPIPALQNLQESTELNGNRAVHRSRLLLDQDLAARSLSVGQTYNDLGFFHLGVTEAAESLSLDASNYAAHRFMADIYATQPRHEIARASELLQAQLRQPRGVTPLQPQLANDELFRTYAFGPTTIGLNEFSPLFLSPGLGLQLFGLKGNGNTSGEQAIVHGTNGPISFGVSQFQRDTERLHPNGDEEQRQSVGFLSAQLVPDTNIQFEVTRSEQETGDIVSRFDPAFFDPVQRGNDDFTSYRIGAYQRILSNSELLLSVIKQDRTAAVVFDDPDFPFFVTQQNKTSKAEFQFLSRPGRSSVLFGANYFEGNLSEATTFFTSESKSRHVAAYVYGYHPLPLEDAQIQLGASYDKFKARDAGEREQANPKAGLIWHPFSRATVRAAYFRVLKRRVTSDQGLEPTQIAGFNQFFDDENGTRSTGAGLALDWIATPDLRVGVQTRGRNLTVPLVNLDSNVEFFRWTERTTSGFAYWTPSSKIAISTQISFDRYRRHRDKRGDEAFTRLNSLEVPTSIRFFHPSGVKMALTLTWLRQSGEFTSKSQDLFEATENSWLLDADIAYRLPRRMGTISLYGTNLAGTVFRYQEVGLRAPRYVPERQIGLRLSLLF